MTGLPLFLSAALEDCRSPRHALVLKSAVLDLVVPGQPIDLKLEQQVVDAVVSVMGLTWRPSVRWRERLVSIGRQDLAAW